jgi:TRAP transporter TAXI family solute receptor
MTNTNAVILRLTLAGAASLVALFAADNLSPSNPPDAFVTSAAARGGRPVTPMSYAGAASRTARPIPQWARTLLVGLAVVLATGAGLFAYRWYSQPRTMTLAAGSYDGEAVRLVLAIAGRLTTSGSHIRLRVIDTGNTLEAAKEFAAGKVDLAIVRADGSGLADARTVVLVTYGVVMIVTPPDSTIGDMDDLAGKTVGVVGGEINHRVVEALTREYDLASAKVRFKDLTLAAVPQALRSKEVAALLMVTPISEKYLSIVRDFFPAKGKHKRGLVAVESAGAIANIAQAYESYDLPKGTLRGSPPIPEDDLTTLRVPFYLVANKKLDDDEVTDLTRAIMNARRDLLAEQPLLAQIAAPSTDKDAFIPVHPGAAAFYDDTQQGFFDKYSNQLYYIPMLLGVLASLAAAAWRFIWTGAGEKTTDPLAPLHALAGPIREARSEADLAAIEEQIDNIIRAELARHVKGESRAADSAALSLTAQRLDHLINHRRARLPA